MRAIDGRKRGTRIRHGGSRKPRAESWTTLCSRSRMEYAVAEKRKTTWPPWAAALQAKVKHPGGSAEVRLPPPRAAVRAINCSGWKDPTSRRTSKTTRSAASFQTGGVSDRKEERKDYNAAQDSHRERNFFSHERRGVKNPPAEAGSPNWRDGSRSRRSKHAARRGTGKTVGTSRTAQRFGLAGVPGKGPTARRAQQYYKKGRGINSSGA